MAAENGPRFKVTGDALRFFFRMHAAIDDGRPQRPPPPEGLLASVSVAPGGAFDDYRLIGWCMRGLDEAEFFVLGEIYGPAWFGARRGAIAQAWAASRRAFPRRQFTAHGIAALHRDALDLVARRLISLGLVSGVPRAARQPAGAAANYTELFRRSGFPVRLEFGGLWRNGSARQR